MWHLLACLLLAIVLCAAAPAPPQRLAPFHYISGQLILLDTGVQLYKLEDLKPSTGYEVRVSFPASIPATTKLTIVPPPTAPAAHGVTAGFVAAAQHRRAAGRRLLDCEKLIFSTDAGGAVQGIAEPHLELRAYRRSVHRDGPKAGTPKLVYNIVLAELVLGLPQDSIPTVAAIVGVVLVSAVASFFWSNKLFPQLLHYLVTDGSKALELRKGSSSRAAVAASGTPAAAGVGRKAGNRNQGGKRSH